MPLLVFAGCGPEDNLVEVRGKVTYQGAPVAGATIVFMSDEGLRPATAVSGASGEYRLMTLDAPGAMPGKYTVIVTKTDAPASAGEPPSMEEAAKLAGRPPPPVKHLVPAKYGDARRTPLSCAVFAGQPLTFDIPLAD